MAMAQRSPLLPFLGMRRNYVVPQSMRVVVRTEPGVDDVNMLVFPQLFFNLGPLEQHLLPLAAPLLVFGKTHTMHGELTVKLFG